MLPYCWQSTDCRRTISQSRLSSTTHVSVPALPPLPPRSATEIVDGAVQLIRPQFGYFVRIAAIGAIPALVSSVVSLLLNQGSPADLTTMLRRQTEVVPLLMTLLVYVFAAMQSGAIVTGALAVLRGDVPPSVWTAFMSAFRRLHAIVGAYVLLIVMFVVALLPVFLVIGLVSVALGTGVAATARSGTGAVIAAALLAILALTIVVLIAATLFAQSVLMTTLVVAERLGPFAALRRAQKLSRGNYALLAKTYGLVLLIMLVITSVMVALSLSFLEQQQLVQSMFSVLFIPVAPIVGSIGLVSYADLRVRREGADLDASLDALTAVPVPRL